MNEFSVVMSLVDYIPVLFYTVAIIILQRDLYNKMSKGAFAIFAAGTFNVSIAGLLKATYKLLYALEICNFEVLSKMFFPVQAIGFILAGLGLVAMMFHNQGATLATVFPAVYSGTFIFVGLMVAGLAAMNTVLSIVAIKLKKKSAVIYFIVAFVCSLCMGYLSSKDFSKGIMNWIGEIVNSAGQLSLLLGTLTLHKAGLTELKLK